MDFLGLPCLALVEPVEVGFGWIPGTVEAGQPGATHAWTEIYLPGAGWRGFDPTNHKMAGPEHVVEAVTREQEKAAPDSGYWDGPSGAFQRMEVIVRVEAV